MRAASSGFESSRQCVGADPGKRTREIFKLAWSAGDEIEENQDRPTLANNACPPPGSAWRSRLIPVALHQPDRAGIVIGPHRLEAIAPGGAGQPSATCRVRHWRPSGTRCAGSMKRARALRRSGQSPGTTQSTRRFYCAVPAARRILIDQKGQRAAPGAEDPVRLGQAPHATPVARASGPHPVTPKAHDSPESIISDLAERRHYDRVPTADVGAR